MDTATSKALGQLKKQMADARISNRALAAKMTLAGHKITEQAVGQWFSRKQIATDNLLLAISMVKNWQHSKKQTVAISAGQPEDGYIRIPQLGVTASAGGGAIVSQNLEVVRHLDVLKDWARHRFGIDKYDGIKVVSIRGDSMVWAGMKSGDLAFVNTNITSYVGDGFYVFTFQDGFSIKRLRADVFSQCLEIISYEQEKESIRQVTHAEQTQMYIQGHVAGWWTFRTN